MNMDSDVEMIAYMSVFITVSIIIEILEDETNEIAVLEKTDNFAEFTVPQFNDQQFKEHFRILPETFEILIRRIKRATNNAGCNVNQAGRPQVTIEKQLLITLWYLANIESFR